MAPLFALFLPFIPNSGAATGQPVAPTLSQMLSLEVGQRWEWSLTKREGGGPRFLGFSTDPGRSASEGQLRLEITDREGETFTATLLSTPNEGEPSQSTLHLWNKDGAVWMQGPSGPMLALEAQLPPRALSSERVPCVAHYLGGLTGRCYLAPGGPQNSAPGVGDFIVSDARAQGAGLVQFFVALGTAGVIIPGNKGEVVSATLSSYRSPSATGTTSDFPLWRAWSRYGAPKNVTEATQRFERLCAKNTVDAESVGAIISTIPADFRLEIALSGLSKVPQPNRPSLLRLALKEDGPGLYQLKLLAASSALIGPLTPATRSSILDVFDSEAAQHQATRLLSNDVPFLSEVFIAAKDSWDDDWTSAVQRSLKTHTPHSESVKGVLEQPSFSEGRLAVLALLVEHVKPVELGMLIGVALDIAGFDSEKLDMIKAHQTLILALPKQTRRGYLSSFSFDTDEATALLGL